MELTTKRETLYGGPLTKSKKHYFVYLRGERIGNGETREDAQKNAKQALFDAYSNLTRAATARIARDGSILVFRMISSDVCLYEYVRDGKSGSSCIGRMTKGDGTVCTDMGEYADYVLGQYQD